MRVVRGECVYHWIFLSIHPGNVHYFQTLAAPHDIPMQTSTHPYCAAGVTYDDDDDHHHHTTTNSTTVMLETHYE